MKSISEWTLITVLPLLLTTCTSPTQENEASLVTNSSEYITYGDEVSFMKQYTEIVELSEPSGEGRIAVLPALQGRVMTSSASGQNGRSYGWINRELFESGDTLAHINPYGGEERFWLGPEGGQFSIFFEPKSEFNLDNWQTPELIDLEPFTVKNQSSGQVVFTKAASLTNYSGFQFDLGIEREVRILSEADIIKAFGLNNLDGIQAVAYQTSNTLTNVGEEDWREETGLLSIWLLGMFNPSPNTTVILPYISGSEAELGLPVNDTYFGKVPEERLVIAEKVIYFSGDGKYRSKIGLSPNRAKNIIGSYDSANGILTVVKYSKPEGVTKYVNSLWEIQEKPYAGDVVNSYNDGSAEPGKKPLGPFYELETSSPALALKVGESGTHEQITCHIEGDEEKLNVIIKQLFGVSIDEIKNAFE
ncbi:MAG: DUF6786 family protein [Bacteroidota bacterium]